MLLFNRYRRTANKKSPPIERRVNMDKRKTSTKAMFDVLNSEFSDKKPKTNLNTRDQCQYYNPPQYAPPTQYNTPKTKVKQSKNVKKSGNSGFGSWILRILLILILAAVLVWIIFMPKGSLSELKEYVTERFSQLSLWEENTINWDFLNKANSTTVTVASTMAASTAVGTQETLSSAQAKSTMTSTSQVTEKSATSTVKKTDSQSKTTALQPATNDADYITVYLKSQLVVICDKNGNVINAFSCSSGKSSSPTRTGNYTILHKYRWRLMIGNCYTQYASSFSGSYLFHSIPYNKQSASTMSNSSYDKLGSPASAGCIRLCCRDSKWIYDNCPIGTKVRVVNESAPDGITPWPIPNRIKDSTHNGWDPTDPSEDSPYNQ